MTDTQVLVTVGVQADEHTWTHTVEHRFLTMPDALTLLALVTDARQTFGTLFPDVEIEGAFCDVTYTDQLEMMPGETVDVEQP